MTSPSVPASDSGVTNVTSYVYICVALLMFYLIRVAVLCWLSPLFHIPGPTLARFTRLWEVYSLRKYDTPKQHIALHEKYGKFTPICPESLNLTVFLPPELHVEQSTVADLDFAGPVVRLAPNRYSINNAEAIKTILGYKNVMDKSNYYHAFGYPDEYNIFTEPSTHVHAQLRRPMAQLYSTTSLVSYEPFIDDCNNMLLKRLNDHATKKDALDVRELMQYYAFDVIGEITVGSAFGLLEENGDKAGILQAIDESIRYAAIAGLLPNIHWYISKVGGILGMKPTILKLKDFVDEHLNNRVTGRSKSLNDRQNFLDKMLRLEGEQTVTRHLTHLVCQQNIAAGSDTTAISLSAAIAYLSMYPRTLAALRQELQDATNRNELSDPATFKDAQKLPYLQAVIYETLRVHPPIANLLVRTVGQGGAHIAGHYFPSGTEVGINAWVIHNNKDIFGSDASIFRPERWLTENIEERALLNRNFLAFGGGPRTCIGKNISFLEMFKVIPQIVRKFDFEIIPDKETGQLYTWETRWFAKPSFRCLVKASL
jgi:cytochrome P450